MNKSLFMLAATVLTATASANAQTRADSAAIRTTALDYIEGWYTADGARMERSLHPELAKRLAYTDDRGRSRLIQMTAMTLVQSTRGGGGSEIPAAERKNEVKILDIYEGVASVRVNAAGWIDYMHMVRWNGQWKIINVAWENEPGRRN
jgi:hypothetical protein